MATKQRSNALTAGARAGLATNRAINNALRSVGMAVINAKEFVQTVFTGRVPS